MKDKINQNEEVEEVVTLSESEKDLADKTIEKVESIVDTVDKSNEFKQSDAYKHKNNAVISYIPFLSLIFLVNNRYKQSDYLFFHVNQGFTLTILWIAVFFLTGVLKTLFTINNTFVNYIPGWVELICYLLYCIALVLSGFGIINTLNGKSKELPVIGKIKLLK